MARTLETKPMRHRYWTICLLAFLILAAMEWPVLIAWYWIIAFASLGVTMVLYLAQSRPTT